MTQTDHLKAILEWHKLVLTASMGAVFLLLLYQIQYPEKITPLLYFGYIVILLIFLGVSFSYIKTAKILKYADIEPKVKDNQNMKLSGSDHVVTENEAGVSQESTSAKVVLDKSDKWEKIITFIFLYLTLYTIFKDAIINKLPPLESWLIPISTAFASSFLLLIINHF